MAHLSNDKKEVEGGAPALPSWQDQFKLRDDLRQRDVYAFEKDVNTLGGFSTEGTQILAAHALKAAISAGWLADPDSGDVLTDSKSVRRYHLHGEDVDDLHPGKVRWYGMRVMAHYTRAVTPPPN